MKFTDVTVVRIYLMEASGRVQPLLSQLHDHESVRGVTVFRGISGFGKSGVVHASSLLDMSLDLPVVVEFFDDSDKVEVILDHISSLVDPGHVVTWSAQVLE